MAVILKSWAVWSTVDKYTAPELRTQVLVGNVYGHPRFADGTEVHTSSIREIVPHDNYKIVRTKNTEYHLYREDVDPCYLEFFPDAYERLSMTNI